MPIERKRVSFRREQVINKQQRKPQNFKGITFKGLKVSLLLLLLLLMLLLLLFVVDFQGENEEPQGKLITDT